MIEHYSAKQNSGKMLEMIDNMTINKVLITLLFIIITFFVLPYLHQRLEKRVSLNRKRRIIESNGTNDLSKIQITKIIVYPIKSCGGISVSNSKITLKGLEYDRQWMLIDGDTGTFVTQRHESRMSLIQPKQLPETRSNSNSKRPVLTLSAPGMSDIDIPIYHGTPCFSLFNPSSWFPSKTEGPKNEGTERVVKVWGQPMKGIDQGDAAGEWFDKFLNRKGLRLVKFPLNEIRYTDQTLAKGSITGYADGFPYLIISEESLAELNHRVTQHAVAMNKYNKDKNIPLLNEDPQSISMSQFRPNIVVKGGGKSFLEDQWLDFIIHSNGSSKKSQSGMMMRNVKSCTRCKMPSVNQTTGKVHDYNNVLNDGKIFHVEPYIDNDDDEVEEKDMFETAVAKDEDEPIRTLKQFRTGKDIQHPNPKWQKEIFFGSNTVTTNNESIGQSIHVGDMIIPLKKQDWVTWEK